MPSTMVHILTAHKVNPESDTLFLIGNIAPDAVKNRDDREIQHLRRTPDREKALIDIAMATNPDDAFREGALLHLYLDWRWDSSPLQEYIKSHGESWHPSYFNEIGDLSAWLFHHTDWADEAWRNMIAYDASLYGAMEAASSEEILNLLKLVDNWHRSVPDANPEYFRPEFIDEFTTGVAQDYINWRNSHIFCEIHC